VSLLSAAIASIDYTGAVTSERNNDQFDITVFNPDVNSDLTEFHGQRMSIRNEMNKLNLESEFNEDNEMNNSNNLQFSSESGFGEINSAAEIAVSLQNAGNI